MRKTTIRNHTETRMLDAEQLAAYLAIGKKGAVNFAKNCGAEYHIGRRVVFDKAIIDRALAEQKA